MDAKTAMYNPMPDDRDELLSTTEVGESLMGDEPRWHNIDIESEKPRKKRGLFAAFKPYQSLFNTFLLLLNLVLLLSLLARDWWKPAPSSSWQVGGDFTGAAPQFTTKVVKWGADMNFAPNDTSKFFSDEVLAKWNTLMPAGTGFGTPGETFFTTSMTHQLHCLYMMTRIYSGIASNKTESFPSDYHSHFLHCVDYLRQGVMCSADLSLEAHDVNDSDDLGPLDGGWSGHHVCKDYGEVKSYLEQQIKDGVRVVLPIDD